MKEQWDKWIAQAAKQAGVSEDHVRRKLELGQAHLVVTTIVSKGETKIVYGESNGTQ